MQNGGRFDVKHGNYLPDDSGDAAYEAKCAERKAKEDELRCEALGHISRIFKHYNGYNYSALAGELEMLTDVVNDLKEYEDGE